jgi:hypothetical protein
MTGKKQAKYQIASHSNPLRELIGDILKIIDTWALMLCPCNHMTEKIPLHTQKQGTQVVTMFLGGYYICGQHHIQSRKNTIRIHSILVKNVSRAC